ncbi:MAG: radical SAM protein [Patescibacteria group bacterium]|mgnify:CR=1 FL=1
MEKEIKQKNILLISPTDFQEMAQVKWLSPPLGIIRLAGFLNDNGHCTEYIDTNFWLAAGKKNFLEEKLKNKKWDIIGFSILDDTLLNDIENIYLARKICPGALLIAGGIEAQFNYQTILDKTPCKIVILGEGEIPFLKLANEEPLEKIPGIVVRYDALPLSKELFWQVTTSIEWEKIPYEEYWDFYLEKYKGELNEERLKQIHTIRIFTRNRCPIQCKFCCSTNQLTWAAGKDVVPVIDVISDGENLVSLIKRIKKAHPRLRTVYFTDDEFCMNSNAVTKLCQNIIKKSLDLSFICLARIDRLNEEVISWMAKANFRVINIGIESFSQKVLNEFNKKYNTEIVAEKLNLLKKYGIHPFISIILISPNSSLDDIEITVNKTLEYIKDGLVTASIALACIPLKGSVFNEEYFDFITEVVDIPGTRYKIKKPINILANDPYVREAQLKFYRQINREIKERIAKDGISHPTSARQAQIRLEFMKNIIKSIREKYGLEFGLIYEIPEKKGELMASRALLGVEKDIYQGI